MKSLGSVVCILFIRLSNENEDSQILERHSASRSAQALLLKFTRLSEDYPDVGFKLVVFNNNNNNHK